VKHLASRLSNRGFAVVALSGELSQSERTHALQAMRDGRARVCVATDVASRGIDLPNLDLVIHADLPKNGETLLHRSGRTGRAGRNGVCVIITPHNKRRSMERLLNEAAISAASMQPPTAEAILKRDRERLLADPIFEGELTDDEAEFARELLAIRSPDQLAAAYLRLKQSGQPTPEEFVNTGMPSTAPSGVRTDFDGGVWFKLSVGRKHKADPRWLLPIICRAGGVTKRDVGTIRISENDSLFEIGPRSADQFIAHLAENGTGEKSITIMPADGPREAAPRHTQPRPDRKRDSKSYSKPAGKPEGGGSRKRPIAATATPHKGDKNGFAPRQRPPNKTKNKNAKKQVS